ncbi:hypothetical protein [Neisseria musculi]|uniref:Uncharacterized protein n=1 Tax=Neisseria musculi TaxID=1815583 RepID=A0A7H1M8G3_9NEIS|nr:hypothetical protein [Neisseria musculi]QNT57928.1 hypothetical protein H7A79_2245 [Neisseria musculi]QNT60387.1 hypothetical protein H7A79_2246 [Neisseria musculi]
MIYPLTEIPNPALPPADLVADNPAWSRAGFNRACSGSQAV